ncbi:LysM peptidoglycan-binding domain-containing protein [Corallococcus aberystwythensis]|uniref:LysM peptidoglycan-binding domain-containing protein n=1 Tax=Corallococcus aberystwythensis TaxID=2316722 RepID=UPI001315A307|nr:LysM peptidoglycan-binding domain-containing protein [Corallococcus aberystwythensis]
MVQNLTIRRGDTLSSIANRHGTTVAELAKTNNIKDPNRIIAGAKLKVQDGFDAKPKSGPTGSQQGDVFEKSQPKQPTTQASQQPQDTRQTGSTTWKDSQTGKSYPSRDGVPVYNQGDGDWKDSKLKGTGVGGAGDRRIGNKGCAMSACAMAVSALSGETVTPAEMDRHLDANGGYDKNSNVVWEKTTSSVKTQPPITTSREFNQRPGNLDQHLAKGKPVVIGVDRTGDGKTDHWMTVTGKNPDGSYRVNDPAGGKTLTMEMRNGKLASRDVPGKTYTFTGDAVYFSGGKQKTGQGASTPTQTQPQTQTPKQTPVAPKQPQNTNRPNPGGKLGVAYADNTRKAAKAQISTDPRYAAELRTISNLSPEKRKLIDEVARKADLPPALVAGIWYREASLKNGVYLHNGQELGKTTTIVPKGVFFRKDQFVDAAVDALRKHSKDQKALGLHYNSTDTGAMASYAEAYNGFGYRNKGVTTPYAFAGTDQYKGGMYVKDGDFRANVYDKRLGVMAVALEYMKGNN